MGKLSLIVGIFAGVFFLSAQTQAGPSTRIYGGELTVTNDLLQSGDYGGGEIVNSKENQAAQAEFERRIRERCRRKRDCEVTRIPSKRYEKVYDVRVTYKNGMWFECTLDPGVLEFKIKPSTLAELKKASSRFHSDIYELSAELDLFPDRWKEVGGGHYTIDYQTGFDGKVERMAQFIQDAEANSLLYMETELPLRSIDIVRRQPDEIQKFNRIQEKAMKGGYRSPNVYVRAIRDQIYKNNYDPMNISRVRGREYMDDPRRNAMLSFESFDYEEANPTRWRVEGRSRKPFDSFSQFVETLEVIDHRLDYLKKQPIRFAPLRPTGILSHREAAEQILRFFGEMKLDVSTYSSFYGSQNPGVLHQLELLKNECAVDPRFLKSLFSAPGKNAL